MSLAQPEWLSTGSTERPITFTPRRSNSGLILAMYPSSVVQTGVKSFGCEKSTAQESPIQSWKRIRPSVVSASKSGAVSPSCSAILLLSLRVVAELRGVPQSAAPAECERTVTELQSPDPFSLSARKTGISKSTAMLRGSRMQRPFLVLLAALLLSLATVVAAAQGGKAPA